MLFALRYSYGRHRHIDSYSCPKDSNDYRRWSLLTRRLLLLPENHITDT